MNEPQQSPHIRRQSHQSHLVQLLPEVEALCGIEAMFALDRGASYEEVRLDLVAVAIEALGSYATGRDLLRAWVDAYLADTMWFRVPWTDRCNPLLWIEPCKTIHLLSGGWIHVEMELEFERVSDVLYLPRVREVIREFLPPPPAELFEVVDDPEDPFRPW